MVEIGVQGRLPLDEVSRRGKARYEELRKKIEAEHWNRYIAIDAENGDYEIADRRGAAWRAIHSRHPNDQAYIRKIGEEPEPLLAARAFGGGSLSLALIPEQKK